MQPPPIHPRKPALGAWDLELQGLRAMAEFSQLPRVFLCLHAGAWQLFLLNGTLSWSKFNFKGILLKIKAQSFPSTVCPPYKHLELGAGRCSKEGVGSWANHMGLLESDPGQGDTGCGGLSFERR